MSSLTQQARRDVELAATEDSLDDLLRRGLDWLTRITRYDLATLFVLHGDTLVARTARGPLADARVRDHTLQMQDFPTIREALETRRARAYTEDDHRHGDGDPFDGLLDLPPGHACMVVPLCAGERRFGVLTLDRTHCEPYPPEVVELVEVYSQIFAIAIQTAEQRNALQALREQEMQHTQELEAQLGGHAFALATAAHTPAMRELLHKAQQVARTQAPVLILGETGTGKEHLARALHRWSPRAQRPFVTVNCAAIPPGLMESELFGHVKGAFTGANRDRAGRFVMADGGTLLLDEIGELPVEVQAKLLRVLQEGTLEPVGSDTSVQVDVRILAATHVDLPQAIEARRFREDLYYRLNVFPLSLPPLRARGEDLAALCAELLMHQGRRTGRQGLRVTPLGLAKLRGHAWPGNLRELANVLERAAILTASPNLGPEVLDVPPSAVGPRPTPAALSTANPQAAEASFLSLDNVQRVHIETVLAHTHGRIYGTDGAAALLGLKPSTLQSRMKKLGVVANRDSK